ncbi:MAG: YqgE/AlgH family protein [Cyclobacteriaceae bacterium]|jgi:putative transcriptional regulator|nr:YqgE/AlgH family protein [Cyclobacteriaceae bacterium]
MEFFKFKNKLRPEKGRLLISEPFLPDPNFERTVVLLCEHNEEGSFGFVLNKPAELTAGEIMDELENFKHAVYIGGPVQQDTLHFIHRNPAIENGTLVREGIFWGGSFEQVLNMADTYQLQPAEIKFFLGYSGWDAGQLEDELEQDSWIVCDFVTEELLFETEPSQMWKKALGSMGGRFSVYSNYPVDPRLN